MGGIARRRVAAAAAAAVTLVFALALTPAIPAAADDETSPPGLWLSLCREFVKHPESGAGVNAGVLSCGSYIRGFLDSAFVADGVRKDQIARLYCLPNLYSVAQIARVFVGYADKHPQVLQQSEAVTLHLAITEAFPCPAAPVPAPAPAERRR